MKEIGMSVTFEKLNKLLLALEENRYPATPRGVREMVRDLAPGEDPEVLAEKVLEEARRRTRRALDDLWEAFGLPSSPAGVEESLLEGRHVTAWYPGARGRPELHVWPQTRDKEILPLPRPVSCGELSFNSRAGWVEVEVAPGLFATWERAFFRGQGLAEVREAIEGAGALRPLFQALGLADLEKALLALATLKEGEGRMEGPYALVRTGGFWFLRRGSLFGDPLLDGAFLTGQAVKLAFPGGIRLTLKGSLSGGTLSLQEGVLEWGDEAVRFRRGEEYCGAVHAHPISHLVRMGLWWELDKPLRSYPPRVRTLIEELRGEEDPIEALRGEDFSRRVHMGILALH
jgi:hypothetical protein